METLTSGTIRVLSAFCGAAFAIPTIFFGWYTGRLVYLNLTMKADEIAPYRTGGMLIGAIAFPLASIICGLITFYFLRKARRGWATR